ncbi:hypothetical protein Hanom_Chr09g00791781 [Helianthus anomalus]
MAGNRLSKPNYIRPWNLRLDIADVIPYFRRTIVSLFTRSRPPYNPIFTFRVENNIVHML